MTIIVTDSGLGGISVAAELYRALQARPRAEKTRIIFFNALFDEQSGYNRLTDMAAKIRWFDAALHGMLSYAPDVIGIACNTLSVLYPRTAFARTANLPVIGIVEIGVNYLCQKLKGHEEAYAILFATPTTLQQGTHQRLLREHFPERRIIAQACPELMYAIGDGATAQIKHLIAEYTRQAVAQLPVPRPKVYASLNCTHFGYYQAEFEAALRGHGLADVAVVNPNAAMVHALAPENKIQPGTPTELSIECVSKVKFHPQGLASLLPLLTPVSEEAAAAFRNYQYQPDLF